jgi:hypothetical protein
MIETHCAVAIFKNDNRHPMGKHTRRGCSRNDFLLSIAIAVGAFALRGFAQNELLSPLSPRAVSRWEAKMMKL